MVTQRYVGEMLTQFITELVTTRLEPQQKQLAEVLQKVREKVDPKPAVVPTTAANGNANGEAKAAGEVKRTRGRPPGKSAGKKRGGWQRAAPLVINKGGRPKGGYKIPKAQWARVAKRLANGESGIKLGKELGVTPQTVYNIVNRMT